MPATSPRRTTAPMAVTAMSEPQTAQAECWICQSYDARASELLAKDPRAARGYTRSQLLDIKMRREGHVRFCPAGPRG